MNQEQYRTEVDAVSFSPDFQARTVARLTELGQKKETKTMKTRTLRTGLVAAAVAALLCVSAFAAVMMLTPQDVAQRAGNDALAAFESEEAIVANETQTVDGYNVTFMGLVSGRGLSRLEQLPGGVAQDKTYAVLSYARTDGAPIEEDVPEFTVSPLVEGYAPWVLNAWTLNGGTCSFAQDGVLYYLLECDSVEPFADGKVYLAVYPGTHIPPSAERFAFDEATGAISVKEGADAAMFTLPLDQSKADPQKAQEIINSIF